MTEGLDFIAIDFETATGKRAQIAECSRHHIPPTPCGASNGCDISSPYF